MLSWAMKKKEILTELSGFFEIIPTLDVCRNTLCHKSLSFSPTKLKHHCGTYSFKIYE